MTGQFAFRHAAVLLVSLLSAGAQASPVTAGQLDVNDGVATYSVPIAIPPGVSGLLPGLALTYSSQGGQGLAGVGWSISGLSAITRCPQSKPHDGVVRGIKFDLNDRYCLDGQRLMLVSGSYGANASEYRTEQESFSKIVAYGAEQGPSYFRVWTKSGQVFEYGNTDDSKVQATGRTAVRLWAVNKVQDASGNYLNVRYVKNGASGEHYPDRVEYAGNDGATQLPKMAVRFVYESRPDVLSHYLVGTAVSQTVRLSAINVVPLGTSDPVRTYTLTYYSQTSPLTSGPSECSEYTGCATPSRWGSGFSVLKAIQECVSQVDCLPPLTFEVSPSGAGYTSISGGQLSWLNYGGYDAYTRTAVDLNGDGLTDLVWIYSGVAGLYVYSALSRGDGTLFPATGGRLLPGNFGGYADYTKLIGEFNGDGIPDIGWVYSGAAGLHAYTALGRGDGNFNVAQGGQLLAGSFGAREAYTKLASDLNGDGYSDLVWVYSGESGLHVYRALSNGAGGFSTPQGGQLMAGSFGGFNDYTRLVDDFNADGLADIAWLYSGASGLHAYTALGKGDGSFLAPSGGQLASGSFGDYVSYTRTSGDLNGDGSADLLWVYSGESGLHAYSSLSKGDGSFLPATGGRLYADNFGEPFAYTRFVADVDGDDTLDLMWVYSGVGGLHIYTARGLGDGKFSVAGGGQLVAGAFGTYDAYTKLLGDFDGDAAIDIGWSYSGSNGLFATTSLNNGQRPNVLTAVSAGGLSRTEIQYQTLSQPGVYTKDSGASAATYPVVDVNIPQMVVAAVRSDNGLGGRLTTSYQYGGLKIDQSGRGSLGYRWQKETQVETGSSVYTTFNQQWPHTGVPMTVQRFVGAVPVSLATYSYGCNDFVNATGCTVAPGRRYFTYLAHSVEKAWDLNGVALPGAVTSTQYDCDNSGGVCYGNALSVSSSVLNPDGTDSGYRKTTQNIYFNNPSKWHLGRLLKSTVTSVAP